MDSPGLAEIVSRGHVTPSLPRFMSRVTDANSVGFGVCVTGEGVEVSGPLSGEPGDSDSHPDSNAKRTAATANPPRPVMEKR